MKRAIAAIALCTVLLTGCSVNLYRGRDRAKVEPVTGSGEPRTVGTVLPRREAEVHATRNGVVGSINVELGDKLKAGQTIATLEADQTVHQLQADLTYMRREYSIALQEREQRKNEMNTPTASSLRVQQALGDQKAAEQQYIDAQVVETEAEMRETSTLRRNAILALVDAITNMMYTGTDVLSRHLYRTGQEDNYRRRQLFSPKREEALSYERSLYNFYQNLHTVLGTRAEDTESLSKQAITLGEDALALSENFTPDDQLTSDQVRQLRESVRRELNAILEQNAKIASLRGRIGTLQAEKVRQAAQSTQRSIEVQVADKPALEGRTPELVAADIARIEQQLGAGRTVQAPFTGVVTKRHVNIGDGVYLDQPIVTLVDDSEKFVRFAVAERDFAFLHIGEEVEIAPLSLPTERVKAIVRRVAPAVDPETKTVLVEADIEDPATASGILPHMSVLVFLPTDLATPLMRVPEDFVELDGGSHIVWVLDTNDEARPRTVSTLFTYDGYTYIQEGISAGDTVVMRSR